MRELRLKSQFKRDLKKAKKNPRLPGNVMYNLISYSFTNLPTKVSLFIAADHILIYLANA